MIQLYLTQRCSLRIRSEAPKCHHCGLVTRDVLSVASWWNLMWATLRKHGNCAFVPKLPFRTKKVKIAGKMVRKGHAGGRRFYDGHSLSMFLFWQNKLCPEFMLHMFHFLSWFKALESLIGKELQFFPTRHAKKYFIPGWKGNADHDPSLWWVFHFRVISPFPTRSSL